MLLETNRLLIRPYQKKDFEEIEALLKDPLVMKFSLKGPIEKEEAKKYIQNFFVNPLKNKRGLWPLILKENKKIVGFAGFIEQEVGEKKEVELSYRLSPKYWGQGYAKEACLAICKYAHELKIRYLIAIVDPKNLSSMYLAKSIGFEFYQKWIHKGFNTCIYRKEL